MGPYFDPKNHEVSLMRPWKCPFTGLKQRQGKSLCQYMQSHHLLSDWRLPFTFMSNLLTVMK